MRHADHGFSTRAVHAGDVDAAPGAPVVNPIVQTTTFFSAPHGDGPVLYTRYGNNPNQVGLQRRIAALEGAEDGVVLGSGMAAMTCAVLATLCAGDHAVAAQALYGGTRTLLASELPRLGIETTFADLHGEWESAIRPTTRLLVVEIPTNPLLRVPDLPRLVRQAHVRGLLVLVDSTFATPINLRPLEHGADLVVHSATKYLGGHSDVTAGAVVGSARLIEKVRARARNLGPALDPHAAWLTERGIKTLAVRMERHNRNGEQLAAWCADQPEVQGVHHPSLPTHPDHPTAARLLDGFGGMLGIELAGGGAAAGAFISALRLAKVAPSLGGVETLVSEPRYTSHAATTAEEREALGIRDGFIRFSLGIEDAADLRADIARGLRAVRETNPGSAPA